jgi:uncharacterized protein YajQ (UPF0234 family)
MFTERDMQGSSHEVSAQIMLDDLRKTTKSIADLKATMQLWHPRNTEVEL